MFIMNINKEIIANVLGYLGAILISIILIPQIIHMIRKKSGKDISYIFLSLNLLSGIIWLFYGIILLEYPLLISNTVIIISNIIIFILKYKYRNN